VLGRMRRGDLDGHGSRGGGWVVDDSVGAFLVQI